MLAYGELRLLPVEYKDGYRFLSQKSSIVLFK